MNFFRDHKNKIIVILLTGVLVVAMVYSTVGKPSAGILSNTVGTVFRPFQSVGTYIANCFKYGADSDKFERENTMLKQQIITMNEKAKNYDKLAEENARLRSMLELREQSAQYTLKAASVIAVDTENWTYAFKLDKGLSDGIKLNDAVINEVGLVGYVSEVGRNWANIVTILDSSSSVGTKVERLDEYCVVQGDVSLYDEKCCIMKYVTNESAISVGDILVTSGEGGIYPEGITVGKINEISQNTNGLSLDAVVEPVVDFTHLSEVFVITD